MFAASELAPNAPVANPLLAPVTELIDYTAVAPAHIGPAIDTLLAQARAAANLASDPQAPATWEATVTPLEAACEPLWRAWSVAGHLNAVVNTPELRAAYNAALPKVSEFGTWLGLHEGLYRLYQRLRAAPDFERWPAVRQRVVDLALRDSRLSGVELQGAARTRYAEISEQLAQTAQKFSENVLDATDAWSLYLEDESRLAGVPGTVLAAARAAAAADGKPGVKLSLQMPCYLPVMQYAHDRELRATLYRAYATLASEQGKPEFDNSTQIETLLALRAEKARLLCCPHFAALRLQTRMAESADEVLAFLRQLAARARPYAERDLAQLRAHAAEHLGIADLQSWDTAYASEHLRQRRYAYSGDEVKQYFTEPRVLAGLFDVIKTLFNVNMQPVAAKTWNDDVKAYVITSPNGDTLGYLYTDLTARPGKQNGAWVDSERNRRRLAGTGGTDQTGALQTPVVTLTCNFARGQNGQPALLSHDDVITLFHETGHALHAILGEIDEPAASAFAAVEWDAIELPSQFMENFCWEWPVLAKLSAHVETGAPLPRDLFERLLAARNFQSGLQTLRQIEFSLFDMLLHLHADAPGIAGVMALLAEVRNEVAVLTPPTWQRFPHAFSHIFAGGYGAGYYSYKWAEVLSADAYSAFEEAAAVAKVAKAAAGEHGSTVSTLDAATGARFRREIFAVGGARPAAESFKAFRGRAPSIDALLRHSGMA